MGTVGLELHGLLLVDKPLGISSFDVIRALRRQTGVKKIGHAGTLDPLASGLMLMLFGSACKKAETFTKLDKRYIAQITFGASSTTGDNEGEKLSVSNREPSLQEIQTELLALTGEITQTPSMYSAIKINGKEAYKRARAGETVVMPSRRVTIYENTLIRYAYPTLELSSKVSSGTYIRTLADDLGRALGVGGYLSGLVRTEVGAFSLEQATKLDQVDSDLVKDSLLSV